MLRRMHGGALPGEPKWKSLRVSLKFSTEMEKFGVSAENTRKSIEALSRAVDAQILKSFIEATVVK